MPILPLRRAVTRGALAVLATIALLSVAPPRASARPAPEMASAAVHLRLEKSAPAKGEVLAAAPTLIQLWYSLPPEMGITTVRLSDADGKAIPLGTPRRGPGAKDPVQVDVKEVLAAGSYTVSWKTASKDGHPISGDFGFSVKAAAN